METIIEKISQIKKNYFINIFNTSFIDDSYSFLSTLPDEIISQYANDPIIKVIYEMYQKVNDPLKSAGGNSLKSNSLSKLESKKNNKAYIEMITNFIKEKEEKQKQNSLIELECEKALDKYYHVELFEFLKIINANDLVKERILAQKGESFANLLRFEQSVIDFFNKEVNDKEGYTKVKGSQFNFASRIIGKTVTMRFEKEIEVNLLNLVSIIYEVNYYSKWYPFCHVSETLNQPGKAKKCVYMMVEIPVIKNRDFLVYGFGVNRLRENGTILILCRGIEEDSGIFQREYKQVKNEKYVRGGILIFGFEIKVLNLNKVIVRGLCNIDPKISFIPQGIINYVSEKFTQEMFFKFIDVANHYEGSEYQNKNPSKIDKEFYQFIQKEVNDLLNQGTIAKK